MNVSWLDYYNAACDAENGYDGGALDRLTGSSGSDTADDWFDDLFDDI